MNYIRKPRSKPEIEFHNLEKTFNSFFWLKHFCQKSAQQESYCYITLSEAAEALSMRSNFYAIVDRVIKVITPLPLQVPQFFNPNLFAGAQSCIIRKDP